MYRDTATSLDEFDRAVGAILIGEALIDECDRAASRLSQPDHHAAPERWRAVTAVQDTYPEIWRHLDRARRELASRGANTTAYDELRPHARRAVTSSEPDGSESINPVAIDDVKRAMAELKLAVPGADWKGIDVRTQGLVRAPLSRRRRHRIIVASIVAGFALALFTWFLSIIPVHKPDRAAAMRRELSAIRDERKLHIEQLGAELGGRCDVTIARELIKQLVFDGRGADASAFRTVYVARCGADQVIEHWATAPRPHRD